MTLTEVLGLTLAAAAGGAISAGAGAGMLVTFPALLFCGTPPIVAAATSTLALAIGTSGSLYSCRERLEPMRGLLWRFVPVSLAGGLVGALLLTDTNPETFSRLAPFLILFGSMLLLTQGPFRRSANLNGPYAADGKHHACCFWGAVPFQLAVALYGGYFGAGISVLMFASLGFIGLRNIDEMNTLRTVLATLINLTAAGWFILAGLISWPRAGVMTVGAWLGYSLGSHYAQRLPQVRLRAVITPLGFLTSGAIFYKQFLH